MSKVVPFERGADYIRQRAARGRREGRLLDALALFRRAVEREPDNMSYLMDMAETLCEMGCYAESNRVLAGMLSSKDAPDDCYFGMCCNFFGMNELDKAYRAMVQFLASDPGAIKREEVSSMFKNLVLTRSLGEIRSRRVARVQRMLISANEKFKKGDFNQAEAFCRRAMRIGARRAQVNTLLARALLAQGRHTDARKAIDRALESGKPRIHTLLAATEVYLAAGDRKAAQAAFDQIVIDPTDPDERRLLLEAACALGDDERVKALVPRSLSDAPYDRSLLHMCAVNRVREGRSPEQASSFWTRMLLIEPSDAVARHYLNEAQLGRLPSQLPYAYALPEAERARRIARLGEANWLKADQLNRAFREGGLKDLCTWAIRSSDWQGALLSKPLLEKIEGEDAKSLLYEGMLQAGVGTAGDTITWPVRGKGTAILTISGELPGALVPIGMRKAMRMAIAASQPVSGDVSQAVVRLALTKMPQMDCVVTARDSACWAAALLAGGMREAGRAMPISIAARMMGCPTRRAARRARQLQIPEEKRHEDH